MNRAKEFLLNVALVIALAVSLLIWVALPWYGVIAAARCCSRYG